MRAALQKLVDNFGYGFAVALGAGLGWSASLYLVSLLSR
jgi:hypothetical protein